MQWTFEEIKKHFFDEFDLDYLLQDFDVDFCDDLDEIVFNNANWDKLETMFNSLDEKWFQKTVKDNLNLIGDHNSASIDFDGKEIYLEWNGVDIDSPSIEQKEVLIDYLNSKSFFAEIIFQTLLDNEEFWNDDFVKKHLYWSPDEQNKNLFETQLKQPNQSNTKSQIRGQ